MRRLLIILCLELAAAILFAGSAMAIDHEDENIKQSAQAIRVHVAVLDQQLKDHLHQALEEYGNRSVECASGGQQKTLAECIEDDEAHLTRTTITIAKSSSGDEDFLGDLSDAEERFALFTDKMNQTNDLLARAGAKLYMKSLDVGPEMDQLRREVLVYVERKRANDLRAKQALLIAAVALVLIGIFSLIFMVIQRFR